MRKTFKQLFILKFLHIAIFVFILSGYLTSAFATSATVAVSGTRGMISISGTAIFPNNSSTGGSIFFYVGK